MQPNIMMVKGTIIDVYDRNKLLEDQLRIYATELQEIEKILTEMIFMI